MKLNFKKHTAIAVGFVSSLLWGKTCILENQNAIAQVGGMFIRNEYQDVGLRKASTKPTIFFAYIAILNEL